MAITRQDTRVINQPIGVTQSNGGSQQVFASISRAASIVGEIAFNADAKKAKQAGLDMASEMDRENLITLDPDTGKPVALSMAHGFGSIQEDAYNDVIFKRFQNHMRDEIISASSDIAKRANYNPEAYRLHMGAYLKSMDIAGGGEYNGFIADVGYDVIAKTSSSLIARNQAASIVAGKIAAKENTETAIQALYDSSKVANIGKPVNNDPRRDIVTGSSEAELAGVAPLATVNSGMFEFQNRIDEASIAVLEEFSITGDKTAFIKNQKAVNSAYGNVSASVVMDYASGTSELGRSAIKLLIAGVPSEWAEQNLPYSIMSHIDVINGTKSTTERNAVASNISKVGDFQKAILEKSAADEEDRIAGLVGWQGPSRLVAMVNDPRASDDLVELAVDQLSQLTRVEFTKSLTSGTALQVDEFIAHVHRDGEPTKEFLELPEELQKLAEAARHLPPTERSRFLERLSKQKTAINQEQERQVAVYAKAAKSLEVELLRVTTQADLEIEKDGVLSEGTKSLIASLQGKLKIVDPNTLSLITNSANIKNLGKINSDFYLKKVSKKNIEAAKSRVIKAIANADKKVGGALELDIAKISVDMANDPESMGALQASKKSIQAAIDRINASSLPDEVKAKLLKQAKSVLKDANTAISADASLNRIVTTAQKAIESANKLEYGRISDAAADIALSIVKSDDAETLLKAKTDFLSMLRKVDSSGLSDIQKAALKRTIADSLSKVNIAISKDTQRGLETTAADLVNGFSELGDYEGAFAAINELESTTRKSTLTASLNLKHNNLVLRETLGKGNDSGLKLSAVDSVRLDAIATQALLLVDGEGLLKLTDAETEVSKFIKERFALSKGDKNDSAKRTWINSLIEVQKVARKQRLKEVAAVDGLAAIIDGAATPVDVDAFVATLNGDLGLSAMFNAEGSPESFASVDGLKALFQKGYFPTSLLEEIKSVENGTLVDQLNRVNAVRLYLLYPEALQQQLGSENIRISAAAWGLNHGYSVIEAFKEQNSGAAIEWLTENKDSSPLVGTDEHEAVVKALSFLQGIEDASVGDVKDYLKTVGFGEDLGLESSGGELLQRGARDSDVAMNMNKQVLIDLARQLKEQGLGSLVNEDKFVLVGDIATMGDGTGQVNPVNPLQRWQYEFKVPDLPFTFLGDEYSVGGLDWLRSSGLPDAVKIPTIDTSVKIRFNEELGTYSVRYRTKSGRWTDLREDGSLVEYDPVDFRGDTRAKVLATTYGNKFTGEIHKDDRSIWTTTIDIVDIANGNLAWSTTAQMRARQSFNWGIVAFPDNAALQGQHEAHALSVKMLKGEMVMQNENYYEMVKRLISEGVIDNREFFNPETRVYHNDAYDFYLSGGLTQEDFLRDHDAGFKYDEAKSQLGWEP